MQDGFWNRHHVQREHEAGRSQWTRACYRKSSCLRIATSETLLESWSPVRAQILMRGLHGLVTLVNEYEVNKAVECLRAEL